MKITEIPFFMIRCIQIGIMTGMLITLLSGCSMVTSTTKELPELILAGEVIELRDREADAPQNSPDKPRLLILALDGMNRDLLYDMLRAGELPGLTALLGGHNNGEFPHTHFSDRLTATLPSSTAPTWVTAMTGVPPAEHGVAGNEFFIRDSRRFMAPVPVSVSTAAPVIQAYTEGYWNKLVQVPGVYERMREQDPNIQVWVSMHQYQKGADKLILSDGLVLVDAFEAFLAIGAAQLEKHIEDDDTSALSREVDEKVFAATMEQLESGLRPDVLTVYIAGTDHVAHVSEKGPDEARREYLIRHLDPLFEQMHQALEKYGFLDDCYVVLTSDHGHIEVKYDDEHSMAMDGEDEPAELLRKAGYRPRPFSLEVADDHDFNSVLAYQGAMAYVYVADRSTCWKEGMACAWAAPPRYQDDVLTLAGAIWLNNKTGHLVPELKDTLAMVLTRKPRATAEDNLPFEVYVGGGRTVSVAEYLADHPHPAYLDLEARLHDLAVGPHGERAGDILLIARNSDDEPLETRYYFGSSYYSWHGSPSRGDSEIPLIVAHPDYDASTLAARVENVLGERAAQQRFADVLLDLRYGSTER